MTIAVFPNRDKDNSNIVLERIANFFYGIGVDFVMPKGEADFFGYGTHGVENIEDLPLDLAVSIGGDGTLLGVVRLLCEGGVPVCGINIGTLGFLADIELPEIEEKLSRAVSGDYRIEERTMLQGFVRGRDGAERPLGRSVNDVVVTKGGGPKMLHLNLNINGCNVMNYKADGLIVASATGSTAYSLSAGGPLVNPNVKVLLLTPICPHTFNARPMIIDENDEVMIKLSAADQDMNAAFDGKENLPIRRGEAVIVRKSPQPARIVKFSDDDYYQAMRTKLFYNI